MANKYEEKIFEPINNKTYEFREVSVNGRFLFQEFIDNLKDTPKDMKKIMQIYAYMNEFSPSTLLPKTKFRQIKGVKRDDVYEFKKDDIRIYVIKKYPSIFVILGAYKGTQDKNISRINKLFGGF
ncbi:hypothetical protein [Leyella stercorea]|jgi:hypothetical protein|uniref:hypothetical protein n=1 Tax=Leyella stercorea TaxID=363265 RepID=UPI00267067C5|nr:hypothetical protein [Leyella stercorea]